MRYFPRSLVIASAACLTLTACPQSTPAPVPDATPDAATETDGATETDAVSDVAEADSPQLPDALPDVPGDGDTASTPITDIVVPANFAGVCAAIAKANCEGAQACCGDLQPATVAECVTDFEARCLANAAVETGALEAGSASIDAAAFTDCLAAMTAAATHCQVASSHDQTLYCAGMVVDHASPQQPCADESDGMHCADGDGVCFPEPLGTVCKLFGAAGQPCSVAPCAPGLLCITDPEGGAAVCDPPRALGMPCPAPAFCADGLTCVGGVCTPQLEDGQPCNKWFDCGPGLTCDPFSEVCSAPAQEGAECVSLTHCVAGTGCVGIIADEQGFTPGTCVADLCITVNPPAAASP